MITSDSLKNILILAGVENVQKELDANYDYIYLELNIYNAGGSAFIKSMDYDEETDDEARENGQLFCDKDDFRRLIKEATDLKFD